MKKRIFSLLNKILTFFPISQSTVAKISNWANLLYLTLTKGGRYTIRHQDFYDYSASFVENYLFSEKADEKIARLKNSLDEDSQKLIEKILERQRYIYTHNFIDSRRIFNVDEMRQQKIIENFRKKSRLRPEMSLCPESFYYHHGLKFLPENILKSMEGKDVIDGGAYTGDSAMVFCKEYSFGKIYSFEPEKQIYAGLKINIEKYRMKDVIAVNKGIGSAEGTATMQYSDLSSRIHPEGSENTAITTIDNFVKINNSNIGLIKFDIEGSELDGLLGALDTIRRFKPVLLISIYHSGRDFFEIKPYLESLSLGYKFTIKKLNPGTYVNEVMLIAYVDF